jgi:acylphosphatase
MHRERRRLYYSGQVQGVGFRYTCQSLARGFDVSGYVRNLPCGRVEMVAEGDPQELDNFSNSIQQEMGHFIRDVVIECVPHPPDSLSGFTIRH